MVQMVPSRGLEPGPVQERAHNETDGVIRLDRHATSSRLRGIWANGHTGTIEQVLPEWNLIKHYEPRGRHAYARTGARALVMWELGLRFRPDRNWIVEERAEMVR
jgi:hypothetical protein